MRFADLERKLGEIDRARAIYMHASQLADPRVGTSTLSNFRARNKEISKNPILRIVQKLCCFCVN